MLCYIFRILVIYLVFLLYIGRFCYMSSVPVIYLAFLLYIGRSCYISRMFVICPASLLYAQHSCYISHSVLRAVPLPALVRALSFLKRRVRIIHPGRRTRRKTGRPTHNEAKNGPKNETKYEIGRYAANYSPSEAASSGKRGKSRIRERQYSYCSLLIAISAGIPSVSEVVRVSKRSRISTIRSCVSRDGTGSSFFLNDVQ